VQWALRERNKSNLNHYCLTINLTGDFNTMAGKHRSGDDAAINKQALGLIKRGKKDEARQLLRTSSTANQIAIAQRIRKGIDARQTQNGR
jgi:hypothetical protein